MNRIEKGLPGKRKPVRQSQRTLWTGGLALVVVLLVIARLNGGGSLDYSKLAIGLAAVFLVVRQVSRRRGDRGPRAAEPDPKSRLNLQ